MTREELLGKLMDKSIEVLLQRIEEGTITYQELEVARKLLADNNINCDVKSGTPIIDLKGKMVPFTKEEIGRN